MSNSSWYLEDANTILINRCSSKWNANIGMSFRKSVFVYTGVDLAINISIMLLYGHRFGTWRELLPCIQGLWMIYPDNVSNNHCWDSFTGGFCEVFQALNTYLRNTTVFVVSDKDIQTLQWNDFEQGNQQRSTLKCEALPLFKALKSLWASSSYKTWLSASIGSTSISRQTSHDDMLFGSRLRSREYCELSQDSIRTLRS